MLTQLYAVLPAADDEKDAFRLITAGHPLIVRDVGQESSRYVRIQGEAVPEMVNTYDEATCRVLGIITMDQPVQQPLTFANCIIVRVLVYGIALVEHRLLQSKYGLKPGADVRMPSLNNKRVGILVQLATRRPDDERGIVDYADVLFSVDDL